VVRGDCAGAVLIDTSTISAAEARLLGRELLPHSVAFLDAPVSGGVRGAENGQLAIMVGGAEADLERAREVLGCLGKVVHCGSVGAGQVAKACNQLIVMATIEAVAEALVAARASGVDPRKVREALLGGFAASPILELHGDRMLRRDFVPGGRLRFHLKDIANIASLTEATGITLPVFAAAARQVERLVDAGGGDLDHSALITLLDGPSPAGGETPLDE
jgi:2-hydroxy-3-oxopropionate reductase